jgi:hypothetical protein
MMIQIRKCDFCQTDYRNDDPRFHRFGTLEDFNGARQDVCADCVTRLTDPVVDAQIVPDVRPLPGDSWDGFAPRGR